MRFPRIWILTLSKADLLPELDVYRFRDLVIDKVADDLGELRTALEGFVESKDAMAVGEDFILLSSAKFETDRIEVTQRVGLDLVLPLAAMVPLHRHVRWMERKKAAAKVADHLVANGAALATALLGQAGGRISRFLSTRSPRIKAITNVLDSPQMSRSLVEAVALAGDRLRARNAEALSKQDHMAALLTGYQIDLENGENDQVLLLSQR